jgi:hypothetical protein
MEVRNFDKGKLFSSHILVMGEDLLWKFKSSEGLDFGLYLGASVLNGK